MFIRYYSDCTFLEFTVLIVLVVSNLFAAIWPMFLINIFL
jgi:hypothetical protein